MAAILKTGTGSNGILTVTKYALPTQTTPFTYGHAGENLCQLSVYCPLVSAAEYGAGSSAHAHPLSGQVCAALQTLTGTYLSSPFLGVGHETRCYPENYFTMFPASNDQPPLWHDPSNPPKNEGDLSTAAFPGSQCLAGWTTACLTTVTYGSGVYPQAWCCPPGQWTCAASTGLGDTIAPQRLCMSSLTAATEIWMSWDPGYTPDPGKPDIESYTWKVQVSAEQSGLGATVFHKVFPLAIESAPDIAMVELEKHEHPMLERSVLLAKGNDGDGGNALAATRRRLDLYRGAVACFSLAVVLVAVGLFLGLAITYRRRRLKMRAVSEHGAKLEDLLELK